MTKINPDNIHQILAQSTFVFDEKNFSFDKNISDISIQDNKINCIFRVNSKDEATQLEPLLLAHCKKIISQDYPDYTVSILLTAQQNAPQIPSQKPSGASPTRKPASPFNPQPIQGVKKIIAVAAGKGGVGKSTVSLNLAISLANMGYNVGLVDADIHGPSLAKMTGIDDLCESDEGKILPHEKFGVKLSSIAFLTKTDGAMIWRGPMVSKALNQLFSGVAWSGAPSGLLGKITKKPAPLDVLLVDFPPGTGDIQITISQQYRIDGAILVSTPQQVSLLDVKKAADMFNKVGTPLWGIINNMAYFQETPDSEKHYIFGKGNVNDYCTETQIPFLGDIAISPALSAAGDEGEPVTTHNDAPHIRENFLEIARKISASL